MRTVKPAGTFSRALASSAGGTTGWLAVVVGVAAWAVGVKIVVLVGVAFSVVVTVAVVATVGVDTVVAGTAGVAVAADVGLGWIGNLHAANKSAAVQSETNFGLNLFINYPPQFVRSIYSTNYRKFCPSVEVSEWIMLCCYLLFGEAESADAALL